jgi:NADH-quinone oxidoreductase subunit I
MDGSGIIRGLLVTLKHFFETYLDDLKWLGKKYFNTEGIARRSSSEQKGIFTVQYPEEKIPVPEEFRFVPFLVYDEGDAGEKNIRCTSCGICAKVCPPQCIWIVRSTVPETGKPILQPAQFTIDMDICMNCGLCAEYCPFDAIKMDHDYELATTDRLTNNVHTLDRLLKPASYYAGIRPENYAREEAIKAEKAAAKAARPTGNDSVSAS